MFEFIACFWLDFDNFGLIELFVLLLLIGMPLKYMAGIPLPVKILGWIHGVLFVAYCGLLLNVWIRSGWHFFKVALALLVSFIPLGTFWFERKYLNENQ